MPELAYAAWERMKLDNAKANLADDTIRALRVRRVFCRCRTAPQSGRTPLYRAFFGTIASRLSSRLPGYTGSHPRDLRRALADPKGNLRLYVSLGELEELLEYSIASYNGTPHSGLNNATPLEAMEFFVRGRQTMVTWLAEHHRRTLCLMQSARRCPVRAYLDHGIRPHVNLHGVRYTNSVLATSTHLIGQRLLVYMNADDLRCVRAFLPDGGELGLLDAQGAWRVVPHNLKLRQEIRKQKGRRRTDAAGVRNPIEAYVQQKLAQAKKTRKAASELAHAVRLPASAPTVRTPAGPARASPVPETLSPVTMPTTAAPVDSAPIGLVHPRKLTIGTGQIF